jgi:hypothetical protein
MGWLPNDFAVLRVFTLATAPLHTKMRLIVYEQASYHHYALSRHLSGCAYDHPADYGPWSGSP